MKFAVPPALAALWQDEKKRAAFLVAAGILGMLLIVLPEFLPARSAAPINAQQEQEPAAVADYARDLETRLETLLVQVEGAGKVQVMVTLIAGEETVYAQDRQTYADGASQQTHVLLKEGDPPALITTVTMPAVQGVAVVCQGGGDVTVQSRITQIVQVLTGIGASHITVTPMVTAK